MMKTIKQFIAIVLLFTTGLFVTSCSSSDDGEKEKELTPKISLESINATETTLSFFITLSDAETCSYYSFQRPQEGSGANPTAEEIFKEGINLNSVESQLVTIKDLTPDTEYIIAAAAKSKSGKILVAATALTLKTKAEEPEPDATIVIMAGSVTTSSLDFTIIPSNSKTCAYHYFEKPEEGGIPVLSGKEIFESGTTLSTLEPQVITIEELVEGMEYVITAAVTDIKGGYVVVESPLVMTIAGIPPSHKLAVAISDVSATYDAITYTVTPTSAARLACDIYEKIPGFEHPDAMKIFYGTKIENILTPSTITFDDLRDNTTYVIYAAVESGDGLYNREMAYQEVTTATRPTPIEMPEQSFTTGRLDTYFNGRNYIIITENAEYSMYLDIYGSLIPPSRPIIEEHEYTYTHDFSTKKSWMIITSTKIVDKSTGAQLNIEKGSLTVAYVDGIYTVTGGLVTKDNKKFNFKYTGQLPYPIKDIKTGNLEVVDTRNVLTMEGEATSPYSLSIHFRDNQPITATHIIGATIMPTSILLGLDGTNYTFTSGRLTIEETTKDRLKIYGEAVLNNGDIVNLNLEDVNVSIPSPPVIVEKVYTTASATCVSDIDILWGMNIYELKMKNDDGEAFIEFGSMSGNVHAVQPGTYLYNAASEAPSSGGIGTMKVSSTEHGDLTNYFTTGTVVITKSGNVYTVTMDIGVSKPGDVVGFKATYVGEIPCIGYEYN